MALPNQLKSARLTNAVLGSLIDDEVGNAEKAIAEILGIPIDTNIQNKLFEVVAVGLRGIILQDAALDPTIVGELLRNADRLRYHNGAVVKTVPYREDLLITGDTATENVVANTVAESSLFVLPIAANALGSNGMIHGSTDVFVSSMLNGAMLQLRFYWGGSMVYAPQIINLSGSTQSFGISTLFRLHNRNSTGVQGLHFISHLPANTNNLLRFNLTGGGITNSLVLGATKDTTLAQLLQFNVMWNSADPANSCFGLGADVYRTR